MAFFVFIPFASKVSFFKFFSGIIILFPQAKISEKNPLNPNGCWDYWGYNEENIELKLYATKQGKQISAVWNMINDLVELDD